jgi:hypothetical protein
MVITMNTDTFVLSFDTVFNKIKYFLLAFFALIIYFSTFSHNFLPDDWYLLGVYQKFDFFREFFIAYFGGAFSLPIVINGFYRPINSIFYYFGYTFFGVNPIGYKIVVFIFFILGSFLVFKLSNIFFKDQYISFLASVIYISRSVHDLTLLAPSGIVNVCSDFFMLLSLYCYLNFKKSGIKFFFILSILAYCGAFFSKEGSVILFILILYIELFSFNKQNDNVKSFLKTIFPFLLIFLLYLIRIFFFRMSMISTGPYSMSFSFTTLLYNFLFFINALFNNPFEILLFIIFFVFCLFSKFNARDFFNKNFLFIGILIIGLGPYLFLKTQIFSYYCGFSAIGFSAIFAYILLSNIKYNLVKNIVLIIFVAGFILSGFLSFQSYQDINNPTNPFTYQEQKINNVINYLEQTNLSYENATIVFVNSNTNLYAALGYGAAIKLNYKNVNEVYFDNTPMPKIDNMSKVYYFNYVDGYQNISLISSQ